MHMYICIDLTGEWNKSFFSYLTEDTTLDAELQSALGAQKSGPTMEREREREREPRAAGSPRKAR
jgi:hypothetical protein